MCKISRNKYKPHYLKNKSLFVDFLLHFWKSCKLEDFERKDEYPSLII